MKPLKNKKYVNNLLLLIFQTKINLKNYTEVKPYT